MTSYHRAPNLNYRRISVASVLLLCLMLFAFEAYLTRFGHSLSFEDDKDLWSLKREQVYQNRTGKNLVLIGASRIKANLSYEVLKREFPEWNVVNLSNVGKHPVAVLRDLSDDEEFIGTVVASVWPRSFLPENLDDQAPYVAHFRNEWGLNRKLNKLLALEFQERLRFLNSNAGFMMQLRHLISHGRLPNPHHVTIDRERFQSIDFSMINVDLHRSYREKRVESYYLNNRVLNQRDWLSEASEIINLAEKIRARGGEVVFIRMPTEGKTLKYDLQNYPKERYWDLFSSNYKGTTIHFLDNDILKSYRLPDTSHLDHSDKASFTADLANSIRHQLDNSM